VEKTGHGKGYEKISGRETNMKKCQGKSYKLGGVYTSLW